MAPKKYELSDRANKILAALREAGDWVSRVHLADLLGQEKKLRNNDVILLQRLKNEDLIEVRRDSKRKYGRPSYEYRAK